MQFKEAVFERGYSGSYWASMAFGLYLHIELKKGVWCWKMHNLRYTICKGKCESLDEAKQEAQKAFRKYVDENLAKCVEVDR